jgi:hypothetical protein
MASRQVVLKIKNNNGVFVNAEKNTNDNDEEEHPGTLTIGVDGDDTLAEYTFTTEDGTQKKQYFKTQDNGLTWNGYINGKTGDFDNNGGVHNIFKFEDATAGAGDGDGDEMDVEMGGGSRKKSKKSKSKKSKRKTKGGKKQKKQSKSRKQRR